jgi:demethylmenaquinone methyltransferase/2-methoxy-6-polyprenyl-1,4-benzoquinol methylase
VSEPVTSEPDIVENMREYYARRAAIYERVYHKPERQADLRAMEAWLGAADGPFAGRRVLEIACGTGWWTPHAARHASRWLATDLNPETMALARAKALPSCVEFARVDAYALEGLGDRCFDAAFAGCWWSHVPLARLSPWLERLQARLEPGARMVFLDNSYVQASNLPITRRDADGNTYQQRTLDDGSTHEVLKNFPTREQAFAALGARARETRWIQHAHYWILDARLA